MASEIVSSDLDGVHQEVFEFDKTWRITTRRSRILQSKCTAPFICNKEKESTSGEIDPERLCKLCRYETHIKVPYLPEMTFADNILRITHKSSGSEMIFEPMSALKNVDLARDPLKVAAAEGWLKARADCSYAKNIKKSFDWTYTTDYMGDIIGDDWHAETTDERIDFARLQVKEEILFYDEIDLFEDELADHGVSKLSVKFRAMRSGFYILLRFFLRVDAVFVRINDTRIYHKADSDYLLREYTNRECTYDEIRHIDQSDLVDANKLSSVVPIRSQLFHKLTIR